METKPNKSEIAKQIKTVFDFVQKLYNESSYLIKEIEGQLGESEYRFQILRPSGYSVSRSSSTGLEPNNVNLWVLRKFSVAFVEESNAKLQQGQTFTKINDRLRVLYFRIILDDKNQSYPQLVFGVFYDIKPFKISIKKFEHIMGYFENYDTKLFEKFPNIDYKDGIYGIRGKLKKINLLEINTSDELIEKVINPAIKMYEWSKKYLISRHNRDKKRKQKYQEKNKIKH